MFCHHCFHFDLEYALRMIQENKPALELIWAHQRLVCANVTLLGENIAKLKHSSVFRLPVSYLEMQQLQYT